MAPPQQGSFGFWNTLEFVNAIFQDLEGFGKREAFQNSYGKVLDF